jgi:hypothetical protein
MVQGMMSHYIDQSKNLFVQMQEQMQQQARTIFPGFPFPGMPGAVPPASSAAPVQPAPPRATPVPEPVEAAAPAPRTGRSRR